MPSDRVFVLPGVEGMRFVGLCCGIILALALPAMLSGQAQPTKVPSASNVPVHTKKVAREPTGPSAKELFSAVKMPTGKAARSIGFYAKGCLAGAKALPIDGAAWQVMRLSRNRNWGHPNLIALIEKLAVEARAHDGWPGLLVGDISQPRGGPMPTGHASHQVGLDADIWLTPMPEERLSAQQREELSATSMLADDMVSLDPHAWTDAHVRVIKRAASYPIVERIFVHPAIKKALCEAAAHESDRSWLHKVRAYWGHNDHFHLRISCPTGSPCRAQPPLSSDDGCGKELTRWLALVAPKPPAPKPAKPAHPPRPEITLDQLPAECREVLTEAPGGIAIPEAAKPTGAREKAAKTLAPAKTPRNVGPTAQ
jgi:penicillin-insensitive murein DD-endopeptidase